MVAPSCPASPSIGYVQGLRGLSARRNGGGRLLRSGRRVCRPRSGAAAYAQGRWSISGTGDPAHAIRSRSSGARPRPRVCARPGCISVGGRDFRSDRGPGAADPLRVSACLGLLSPHRPRVRAVPNRPAPPAAANGGSASGGLPRGQRAIGSVKLTRDGGCRSLWSRRVGPARTAEVHKCAPAVGPSPVGRPFSTEGQPALRCPRTYSSGPYAPLSQSRVHGQRISAETLFSHSFTSSPKRTSCSIWRLWPALSSTT